MIEISLEPRSYFQKQLQSRLAAHAIGDGERDDAQAKILIRLIGGDSEAGAKSGLQARRVRIENRHDPSPNRQSIAVILKRGAIGAYQLLEPEAAKLEKTGGARLGDRFRQPANRIEGGIDRLLGARLTEDVLQHRSGDRKITGRRRKAYRRQGGDSDELCAGTCG
jgi:hypothetical protein